MKLREYILSQENIYLAIYAVRSYVFDPQLLDIEDRELLNSLSDPFDEELIFKIIGEVTEILKSVLDDENYLFKTKVYMKPKDYKKDSEGSNVRIYRPIHTSELKQLIAMVSLLHPLIYEIPQNEKNWKLNLSNYSRLIPKNFYGNRVSRRPEELFKRWNEQYKKYTKKANEYFKTFHESKEYKYEVKLDLENFFPSVNPMAVYGMLMENVPVTFSDDDIAVFKNLIYKLLVCEVVNINNDQSQNTYYGASGITVQWTKGIAQGLPQSYFFGNICMTKIAEIFEAEFRGKSVYYVDDSYIYTDIAIAGKGDFEERLQKINHKIDLKISEYIAKAEESHFFDTKKKYNDFYSELSNITKPGDVYEIRVHLEGKSSYTAIQEVKEGEIYLKTLSREASLLSADITSAYSEEEEEAMLHRAEALLKAIESEMKSESGHGEGYVEKLERYYKFFKYRVLRLRLKTEKGLDKRIFQVLTGKRYKEECEAGYDLLGDEIDAEDFFNSYKHDIWQAALSVLIANTVDESGHETIRGYIKSVIKTAYSPELTECAYINKMYYDYLNKREVKNTSDCFAALGRQTNRKLVRYANMNSNILKEEFSGVRINGLQEEILSSFGICSDRFVKTSIIVSRNSDRLQRMFLNAVYSKVFKVSLSEDIALSSYNKKDISYGELRVLAFLRNGNCSISEFFKWKLQIMSEDNRQKVDYTIFEVLGVFKRYVAIPDQIDHLIMVHKYTCDVWKNGAKHLYFYTLHNQEHAVDLIKNIIKIIKIFSYLRITKYDYYLLFIACYLHDISMVRIASENDFLLDKGDSEKLTTLLDSEWNRGISTNDIKRTIVKTYKKLDDFFETKIRSQHGRDSAEEIRKRRELDFLDQSVRENVAQISESHMMDVKDIYFLKGDAKSKLISYKFDKILLRFADLLDMSQHRVSKPILNHNIDNMSSISAFHWVSHLLTEGYSLTVEYNNAEGKDYLLPGVITETVILSIFVKLSQFSRMACGGCKHGKMNEDSLDSSGFEIVMLNEGEQCTSDKCNFLCRWFNDKNAFLVQEMQALEAYLSRVPVTERFYNTKIKIRVIVSNPTDLTDEQFEILMKKINDNKKGK